MDRPNVIMISCDQLRKDALGCYDNPVIKTPNIDKLSQMGAKCEQMYVACPVCAPNRAAISTGRFPSINGVPENACVLPHDEITLMEVLRRAGYNTYGVGKMHFEPQWTFEVGDYKSANNYKGGYGGSNPQPKPWKFPYHGFEKGCFSEDNRVGPYEEYLKEHGLSAWDDPHSFTYGQYVTVASSWPEEHHQTTWVANKAIEYIEGQPKDNPFFMWVSFIHPHSPFNPPKPYDTMYNPEDMPLSVSCENEFKEWPELYSNMLHSKEADNLKAMCDFTGDDWKRIKAYYYGMISLIDKQVGKLIQQLKKNNIFENTIIIFTSDHGEMMGNHGLLLKNTQYDCVTNVPFIISNCEKIKPGHVWDGLCQSTDIMPTILDLLNIRLPEGVQGKSIMSALNNSNTTIYNNVLIENSKGIRTVRTLKARLSWHGKGKKGELYNLVNDPHCFDNLWDKPQSSGLQREMMELLIERLICNIDPLMKRRALC